MRLLGIDYGSKRIGIATSDEAGGFAHAPDSPAGETVQGFAMNHSVHGFAFPYGVIENDKKAIEEIKKICGEKNVGKIILGESVDYKGRPNAVMGKVDEFKKLLEKEIGLPVVYQREILTTREAGRGMTKETDIKKLASTGQKRAVAKKIEKNDASAAALILRSYMER